MNPIKHRKAMLCALVVAAFVAATAFATAKCTRDFEPAAVSAGSTNNYGYNQFELKDFNNVSVEAQPIMYDFLSGQNGVHSGIVSMIDGNFYILCAKDASSDLYMTWVYCGKNKSVVSDLPHYSPKPARFQFENEEARTRFYNGIENDANVIKIVEAGYTFYVIGHSNQYTNTEDYFGVNINDCVGTCETSYMQDLLTNGVGYDTTIIRSKCDLTAIKEKYHIDFIDSFWDTANYGAHIKSYNLSNSEEYTVLEPTCAKVISDGSYVNTFLINGMTLPMNAEKINNDLIKMGYEDVPTTLANKNYATYEEYQSVKPKSLR